MIVLNSLTLGLADPCDIHCEKPLCAFLEVAEHVIFFFFALEMVVKMVALGAFGKNAYFDKAWNIFDCLIVIVGIMEYMFAEQDINFSAIRALRVFRPLQAINRVPSLRLLVTLIFDVLPMLSNVIVLCEFIFLVFGIIAVQLWAGVLRQRCFFPLSRGNNSGLPSDDDPPDFMPDYYQVPTSEFVCSQTFGMHTCSHVLDLEKHDSMCSRLFADDEDKLVSCRQWVANYTDCRPDAENAGHGSISFDNIGYASIAIFQVLSLTGWVEVMYLIQDASSFWAWIYFFLLVMVGAYFAVKLCLVVIAAQFSVTKCHEKERLEQEREQARLAGRDSMSSEAEEFRYHDSCYDQILDLLFHWWRKMLRKAFKVKTKAPTLEAAVIVNQKVRENRAREQNKKGKLSTTFHLYRLQLRRLMESDVMTVILAGAIVANASLMAVEHHGQSEEITKFIEVSNMAFTVSFSLELFLRLLVYDFEEFLREPFNLFDAIIVLINLTELFGKGDGSGLSVLRLFRLFRLVRILRFFPALQNQLIMMLHTVDEVASFFLLLGFLMFVSALLGMNLFGCKLGQEDDHDISNSNDTSKSTAANMHRVSSAEKPSDDETIAACSNANFDSLFQSIFTVLQIYTRDNWSAVMKDGMQVTSVLASIYFVLVVTIGNYIIFNLLVAILVEGFSSKQANHAQSSAQSSTSSVQQNCNDENIKPNQSKLNCLINSADALFILSPDNKLRKSLTALISSIYFQKISLLFAILSCVVVVCDRPGVIVDSTEFVLISVGDYSISFVFLLEAVAKVVSNGFVFGKDCYLRNAWNVLDFLLLILAGLEITLRFIAELAPNEILINFLTAFRLLHIFRPLRLINRTSGLKMVLQTLALSLKPIGQIAGICCFFFLTFAIFGVQMFKGCFARCVMPKFDDHEDGDANFTAQNLTKLQILLETAVTTRNDCLDNGLEWRSEGYNFDNLLNGLMALFVFATLDGWADMTRIGAKCVGPDLQPVPDGNLWSYVYFISFLFVVCFFAMNMFVGVVVSNYQKVQEQIEAERSDRSEISTARLAAETGTHGGEETKFWVNYPHWRLMLYECVTNKYFELFLMTGAAVNAVSMASEYHDMPDYLRRAADTTGNVFLVLLAVEIAMKMTALGVARYIANRWNQLDVLVTILSVAGIILEEIDQDLLPIDTSIIRIARIFRIARLVKLFRAATNLHRLLDTVSHAIPEVINLSLLFALLFFMYAALGLELYSRFDYHSEHCEGLSRHANFENFGMALLTLFRVFTGDNWNIIRKDVMLLSSNPDHCPPGQPDDLSVPCSVVAIITPFYFVSFVLLAQFVLMNIVVAVLMQQIENLHKSAKLDTVSAKSQQVDEEIAAKNSVKETGGPLSRAFHLEEVVSVASVDFAIRHEICDSEYLAYRLKRIVRPRRVVRRAVIVERVPSSSSLAPSSTASYTTWTEGNISSSTISTTEVEVSSRRPSEEEEEEEEIVETAVVTNLAEIHQKQLTGDNSTAIVWKVDDPPPAVISSSNLGNLGRLVLILDIGTTTIL